MTYTQGSAYWASLSSSQKQMFYDIASKSDGNHTAFEWFMHLVPDELKDDPHEVETYMQGGTVVTSEGETVTIDDRDVSRIQSGENGGEYTTENTIMEDSSVNRARGADNMTASEYDTAVADNAVDTQLIDGSTQFSESVDLGATEAFTEVATGSTEVFGTVAEVAIDCILPAVVATKVAYNSHKSGDDGTTTILKSGITFGGLYALMASPLAPVVGAGLLCVAGVKIYNKLQGAK